jgi:hypothetical protein
MKKTRTRKTAMAHGMPTPAPTAMPILEDPAEEEEEGAGGGIAETALDSREAGVELGAGGRLVGKTTEVCVACRDVLNISCPAVAYTTAFSSSKASWSMSQHVVFTVPLFLYAVIFPAPQHHLPSSGHWNTRWVGKLFCGIPAHCCGQEGSLYVGSVQPMRQNSFSGREPLGAWNLHRPLVRHRSFVAQHAECWPFSMAVVLHGR